MSNNCYYTLKNFISDNYDYELRKIPLITPFSCPNRDGLISKKGCFYCNNQSFNPFYNKKSTSIKDQLVFHLNRLKNKKKQCYYIAYFQTFTNTYARPDKLWFLYSQAIDFSKIKVISIATRPDCLADNTLNVLKKLSEYKEVWLEIGLQSSSDKILHLLNRGHTVQDFSNSCQKITKQFPQFRLSAHLIFGLPTETKQDIINAAKIIDQNNIKGVKIHPLAIIKNTVFADQYKKGLLKLCSLKEYIDKVILFLKSLKNKVAIERISEDSKDLLIAPYWVNQKHKIKELICEKLTSP